MTAGCSRCTRVEWPQSLCCRFLCANDLAVNLHLSDENADSTMLRRRYVFSNSSGFFSCHLSVFVLGPNSLLHGSCKCKSQVSCQHCRSSCSSCVRHIVHQASRILCCQEHLWSSPETPANHTPVPGCYTGRSFSPLHQTMQFDKFISEDAKGISWHPYSLHTVYDNPQSRLAVIRARRVLYAFLLSCAVTFEWLWTRKIWIGICSYLWYLCMVSRSCSIAVDRIQN